MKRSSGGCSGPMSWRSLGVGGVAGGGHRGSAPGARQPGPLLPSGGCCHPWGRRAGRGREGAAALENRGGEWAAASCPAGKCRCEQEGRCHTGRDQVPSGSTERVQEELRRQQNRNRNRRVYRVTGGKQRGSGGGSRPGLLQAPRPGRPHTARGQAGRGTGSQGGCERVHTQGHTRCTMLQVTPGRQAVLLRASARGLSWWTPAPGAQEAQQGSSWWGSRGQFLTPNWPGIPGTQA